MKLFVHYSLLTASLLFLSACGKNEAVNAPAAQAPAKVVANSAASSQPAAATPEATPTTDNTLKLGETEAPPTEHVAELDEPAEQQAEEAANKSTKPILKLAQLPPRMLANSKFKEGVNYQRLTPTQPVSVSPDQVEVTEVFWYGCPHCNALDPQLEAWRKGTDANGKPSYVVFKRIPAAWNDITRFHGRFYFAAESLGKLDELHPLIFQEIHVNGNPLNTIDKAREFFTAHGVSAQDFQKHFGALSIERKLDEANLMAQRYHTTGVPHLVVNGKYFTDVGLAGGEPQLLQLLNELAAREHAKE